MSTLELDAEALYLDLLSGIRPWIRPDTALVGVWSGGAWLAERLQRDLPQQAAATPSSSCSKSGQLETGVISSTLHRDDFQSRGLAAGSDPTHLPFDINGRHILLLDDVFSELDEIRQSHLVDYFKDNQVIITTTTITPLIKGISGKIIEL